jgi:hypothetical protein
LQCVLQYRRHTGLISLNFECMALYIPFHPQVQAIFVRAASEETAWRYQTIHNDMK